MPKVNVIVPVYDVEKYLSRCIDSILNQTLSDFELILVDDGSPDNCGQICDSYASKYNRICVIHQENQGVSVARNVGVALATGQYIAFVDSDDYVHPQMYELLCDVLDNTEYPFVHCSFHRLEENETEVFREIQKSSLEEIQVYSAAQGMIKMMDWKI